MTDVPLILPLAGASNPETCGGKASKLALLTSAGFAVPDGFVLTTAAHQLWRTRSRDAFPAALRTPLLDAYRHLHCSDPQLLVAVRSSATAEDLDAASMAGQYETVLNVATEEDLLRAVDQCFASLDSPRTRAYLAQHDLAPDQVLMAVVVQRQVRADVAGVLFTADPHTASRDRFTLEATWGLGETLVSGLTQPDIFHLDAATGQLLEQTIATKELMLAADPAGRHAVEIPHELRNIPCLSPENLQALHQLARSISAHFDRPQDVEWAFERDSAGTPQLRVLQSRAITTLGHAQAYQSLVRQTQDQLAGLFSPPTVRGPLVLHNLAETLPHPTPLTWSIIAPFMTGDGGFGAMYRLAGFEPSEIARRHGFLELIAGNIYMDASRASEMFFSAFPYRYDPDQLRTNPDAAQAPPTIPAGTLLARMRTARRIRAADRHLAALAPTFDQTLTSDTIPAFVAWCQEEEDRDLAALSTSDLIALWHARRARVLDQFAPHSLLPSLIAGQAANHLEAFLAEEFWQEKDLHPVEAAQLLASPPEPDQTLAANLALHRLAQSTGPQRADLFAQWLRDFGHRGPEEFDLASPRWRDRPDSLQQLVAHLAGSPDPAQRHDARIAQAGALRTRLLNTLPPARRHQLDHLISLARRYMIFREDGKFYLMRGYALLRSIALEAARRLDLADDVFQLTEGELLAALTPGTLTDELRARIAARKLRRHAEKRLNLPPFIDASYSLAARPSPADAPSKSDTLPAHCLSTGIASGPARIVLNPQDAAGGGRELGHKYILVCPSTDPNWTPLFMNAVGLVLERGGSLSHGAVVAREMGIPAVVLPDATNLLRDGAYVTVNAHENLVELGESSNPRPAAQTPLAPPPAGRLERLTTRITALAGAVWLIFLLALWLLPARFLNDPAMDVLDTLLWPLVRTLGRPATVAVLAAAIALATMLLQRLFTDTPRLRAAKARAKRPRQGLAPDIQARLFMAALFPLALLLGPMVLVFLWLPARMDPTSYAPPAPPPAATATLRATIRADFPGDITLLAPASLLVDGPPQRRLPPIRSTLEMLLARMKSDPATPPEKTADLESYLAAGIPPQPLQWKLHAAVLPADDGRFPLTVLAGNTRATVHFTVGDRHAPGPTLASDFPADSPLVSLQLDPAPSQRQYFWPPLASLGPACDAYGWLLIYIAVYLPALFLTKRLLNVP